MFLGDWTATLIICRLFYQLSFGYSSKRWPFCGTLGALAALEIVEAWNEENYRPNKPFEVVVISDEERRLCWQYYSPLFLRNDKHWEYAQVPVLL